LMTTGMACAQNVPKTSLSGPDSLRQHQPDPLPVLKTADRP